ncbi:MAG: glycosyltransferase [Geobacteraceae bacterium]|nr:glycosyltransferase [Geobacteraceae bacterium]
MSLPQIDIIVPVWNRPVETRACLVNLVRHSPGARLILISNGSERETEGLLEEFAEALDERALLISTPNNLGFVRTVNLGLARAEAEFAAVVRSTSIVTEGWLDPLLMLARTRPEAGVIVPRLVRAALDRTAKNVHSRLSVSEAAHGDFAAMLLRRDLHDRIGGFDEDMDGGLWCLKDYARRTLRGGFLTFAAEGSPVSFCDDPPLGSVTRREEVLRRSIVAYTARWGEERAFCVHFPKGADIDTVRQRVEVMQRGGRQGHSFTVLVSPATFRDLVRSGHAGLHRNIRVEQLTRLFAEGRAASLAASLRAVTPGLVLVAGVDGVPFPGGGGSIPFAELERLINAIQAEKYGELCPG